MTTLSPEERAEAIRMVSDLGRRLKRGEVIGSTPYAATCSSAIETALTALEEAEGDRDRQKARADAHEKLVYRDRVWRCDACELRIAGSGGQCLNGCAGAVFPVTWRAECRSAEALLEEATARAEKAEQQASSLLDLLARVRVMFRLDLRKMLEFGKHYNQAVKDVNDAVEAALSPSNSEADNG